MREPGSGRSRGFAFLTFEDPEVVNIVMVKEHFLDGKVVRHVVVQLTFKSSDKNDTKTHN
jgi:RNA recognition motif-containing protein